MCTYYHHNARACHIDLNREILKHNMKQITKDDVLQNIRKSAVSAMRHGTTFSINLDVMQCDFKNEYTMIEN